MVGVPYLNSKSETVDFLVGCWGSVFHPLQYCNLLSFSRGFEEQFLEFVDLDVSGSRTILVVNNHLESPPESKVGP